MRRRCRADENEADQQYFGDAVGRGDGEGQELQDGNLRDSVAPRTRRVGIPAVRLGGMGQHCVHRSTTSVGPTPILLETRPPEGRGKQAVTTVVPGTLRKPAALDVAANEQQRCREMGAVGSRLGHVDRRRSVQIRRRDLRLTPADFNGHSMPSTGTGLGATDEPCRQIVDLVEVFGFEDDKRELDEDVVAELCAEATVHAGAESPREGFEKDGASVGVSVGEGGERADDLICVRRTVSVADGSNQGCGVRIPDEIWVLADPAGGERAIGETPILGADLLLEGGHGVPSVDGELSSTVRNCGPRFGPGCGPDARIRLWLLESEGPGFGPGPCSGLVSLKVDS